MKLFKKNDTVKAPVEPTQAADFLTSVLPDGVVYLTMRRIGSGWVVESLTFKNNELVLEKICEPSMRGTALIKFKKAAVTKLLKNEK